MKREDVVHTCPLCKSEIDSQYLGDPDRIEGLLELNLAETNDQRLKINGLQAAEQGDSVVEQKND